MLRIQQKPESSSSSNESVPLKQVHVKAQLHSFAADVTLTQVFKNEESSTIEAVYCFPVEENAAIYSFIARIDNEREIVAELKEKTTAQHEYSQALAQGHGAYLLEQDVASNDIFIVNIGALKPGSECRITISYVSELDLVYCDERPKIRFVIPTTIAPRYSPKEGGIASPGGTQATYVQSTSYTMDFVCKVDKLDQHVTCISSPSHPITVNIENEEFFLITLSQQDTQLDRDLIVDIDLSQTRTNTIAAVEKGALAVSFVPNKEDCQQWSNDAMNEFLFVIDCSGSMNEDNKIGLACKAMLLFLKSLPLKCRFNIIRFGSSFSPLFTDEVTREYNEVNMCQAQNLIQNMAADLGGTELLETLKWLKKNSPPTGCVRQVFLLTDGEVSNVDEVTRLCRDMAASVRIFSFGLGHSPSRALVKNLARVTNGCFAFIPPNSSVDIYVAKQLARALQPSISNVHVKWNTNQSVLHSIPKDAQPVFFHDRLLFYALLDETMPFDHATSVELFTEKEQQILGVARIDHIPTALPSQTVTRLAVKTLLRELLHSSESVAKERIVELSLKYGIMCPHTAFIGIERRLDNDSGSNADMKLREVPIALGPTDSTRTYQLVLTSNLMPSQHFNYVSNIEHLINRSCALQLESRQMYCSARRTRSTFGSAVEYMSSLFTKLNWNRSTPARETSAQVPQTQTVSRSSSVAHQVAADFKTEVSPVNQQQQSKLQSDWPKDEQELVSRFVELQKYDGLWMLTDSDILQLTGKSPTDFSSAVIDSVEINSRKSVMATALVVVLLERRCASKEILWKVLSIKACTRMQELLLGDEQKLRQLLTDIRDQLS